MNDLTPEQKIQVELDDKFHAAMINDEGIRKIFIDFMTAKSSETTDAQLHSVQKFIAAVDYMIGALDYGICDMNASGGPVHISKTQD
tara:strand:+ start:692 stop:952 length:261 start_codon:yes stop_codon:yes gene_type:complete